MPTSRPLTRLLAALALGCGAALLASCAAAAPAPAEGDPDSSAAPVSEEPSSAQGANGEGSSGGSFTVDAVLSLFPSCEAIGAVVSAQIAGLELSDETIEDGSIACSWISPIGADAVTFGVNVDPNNGAVDVPTPDTIELAGLEYVPDAGLEAAGGIADVERTTGDLRGVTTITNVPGVYVSIAQLKLGVDADFGGTAAVAAAKQLLGIDG